MEDSLKTSSIPLELLSTSHSHYCEVCTQIARLWLSNGVEVQAIEAFRPNSVGSLSPLSDLNANLSTYDINFLRPNPRVLEAQPEI